MRANDIIKAAEKIADEKKLKEEKKQALLAKREEIKENFYKCKQKFLCKEGWQMPCFWPQGIFCLPQYSEESLWQASLQKCSWWKAKDVDAALKHPKQVVRYDDTTDDEMYCVEESDDDVKISDEDTETDSLLTQKLHKVWKSLSPPNHEKTLFRNWYE